MCLSPFVHALQDVVSPSVYLLKVSSAAPMEEQGRGKKTSLDLGRQLHIPRKGLLLYTASFPSSPLQNQEANSHPKSSLCKLSPGIPSRGRKKLLALPLPTFPRHSNTGLNSFKHCRRTSEQTTLPHARFHPSVSCVDWPLQSYIPVLFPRNCLFWSLCMFWTSCETYATVCKAPYLPKGWYLGKLDGLNNAHLKSV